MSSASHSPCLVMLIIIISTTLLFNPKLMDAAWGSSNNPESSNSRGPSGADIESITNMREQMRRVSGDDNVGGELLVKIRILLGLKSPRTLSRGLEQLAPGPSPVEKSLARAPIPPLHSRSPLPCKKAHIPPPPAHVSDEGSRDGNKSTRARRVVIAIVISVGAAIIAIFCAVLLLLKRSRRTRRKRSHRTMPVLGTSSRIQIPLSSTNKVSFDPGPDIFYFNSLAPYLDNNSSLKRNVSLNESNFGSQSKIIEPTDSETGNVSVLDEEIHSTESLSSDNESFYSVCNSHSSARLVLTVSEDDLSHQSANCSPFNPSYISTSPNLRISNYSSTKSPNPPTSDPQKPPCSPSRGSESKEPETKCSSQYLLPNSIVKLRQRSPPRNGKFSDSVKAASVPCSSKNPDASTLIAGTPSAPLNPDLPSTHGDEKASTLIAGTPSAPLNPDLPTTHGDDRADASISSTRRSKPHPTINTDPSAQSLSMTLLCGGNNIPKPPPPPLPPLRPPSFQKGGNYGKGPPPPPFPLQQSTPVGKDGTPLPKLKALHWDKVRAAPDRSMVWDKIRSSSFEFDEEMIESLFGYNLQNSVKSEEAKGKNSTPSKHVLDHKRLQNITILFKAFNATTEQICDALVQGRGFNAQQLEALAKMVPTKEEEEKLAMYEGDINELGPAEQFVKAVLQIPFAFSRIDAMLYKETFEDEVDHLKKSFFMLEEACKELQSSRLFLKLLEAVLKTGNRMNVGTIRGGARAFKLDTLLKLADVKGTDGKTTLLHFVVQEMIRSEGASAVEKTTVMKNKPTTSEERKEDIRFMGLDLVSGLITELSNVKKTASIDLDVLVTSVSKLSSGMSHLKHLTEVDLISDAMNGSFVLSMKEFLNRARRVIEELKDGEDRVLLRVREITEYYHGNVSKDEANPLRIFVIVRDFLGLLDRVCKEVRSLKNHLGPNPTIPFR